MVEQGIDSQLEYLILDSNAFIRGYGLSNLLRFAKNIVTIDEVLQEIRDSKARETLQNLPFSLDTLSPSPSACSEVANFALKSGDFHSLSKTDLKLIALTKMLDSNVSSSKVDSVESTVDLITTSLSDVVHIEESQAVTEIEEQGEAAETEENQEREEEGENLEETVDEPSVTPSDENQPASIVGTSLQPAVTSYQSAILSHHMSGGAVNHENESRRLQEDDDGVGWINSDNAHDFADASSVFIPVTGGRKKKAVKEAPEKIPLGKEKGVKVACFTTDFTMQNLLLQLGLHVISTDGMLVRKVRKFVLRCNACFTVHTKDLARLFCSRCGSNYLSRIAASVDEGGQLKLHLKKNYRIDTTGTKYSVPAPGKQSRFEGELLFREDQLLSGIWRQKVVKINKDIKSAFGEDVTSDVGLHLNKQDKINIGLGKGNPNARKGRERRGKKSR